MMDNGNVIAFVTPFDKAGRGNVTTTRRIKEGYEKRGYPVRSFAYNEGGT
ncbi:hypothetical protein [Salipaludibacillus neizhouensis]|nr:hypothetical protein [Salipaludibacillus neizhouensis]